ncbi:putative AAA family ATPase [Aspergillus steynii IBT 23096]|uniref:Putative AAA family ATPase n=1 Tax=Aspergillus steynii IBT 23096 TaxID=1392250 RepID=A0A2I2GKL7_9EURO|nr:putative AAA family ATPase [Aspergillus steynii IBT 23096]PLB53426.1 putative AAA family ATPase [Aspergillus steynii IBT 23096]
MTQITQDVSKKEEGVNPPQNETQKDENTEEEKKFAPVGTICDVQNLYQTKPDEHDGKSWSKEMPKDLPLAVEDAESSQFALILRNIKCYDGSRSLAIHSVVVQSEPLKKFLGKVLDGYPGVTMTLDRVEFTKPFAPLIHRWDDFTKLLDEEEDATTKEHANLFYNILEEELRDQVARKRDHVQQGVITHKLLWTLFEPDDLLISSIGGRQSGFRFVSADVDCDSGDYQLTTKHIDFDGDDFGFKEKEFGIPHFDGTTSITSLKVFPLRYHPDKAAIREALLARGKIWEQHRGYHYKNYDETAISCGQDEDDETKYHVKSRIIIDAEGFNIFHPTQSVRIDDTIRGGLTDEHRLITVPTVHGYSLKEKEWLRFYIDAVSDITWDSDAFKSLVLPTEQENLKDLILAFAKAQSKQLGNFDDVIQGKGRGIVMQLSGPPGVGKTLTAESVAEVMQVPLYIMSAGDLGSSADDVEKRLKNILRMIPKWGAVLLLDEADVFMEERSATDLERNELVSIFLRMLEYYEGILFLTTNRAERIDPAFESRIHVSLHYNELDWTSRRHIWEQFLGRSTSVFTTEQLDSVAEVELNGRQIKNALKTANLLAWAQGLEMKFEHVKTVLDLRSIAKPKAT